LKNTQEENSMHNVLLNDLTRSFTNLNNQVDELYKKQVEFNRQLQADKIDLNMKTVLKT
jgi:hypothetical protein